MAYTKTNWNNDKLPAINAGNLNNIEKGIEEAHNSVGDLSQLKTENKDNLVNAINENIINYIDNQESSTNEYVNNKRVYVKRVIIDSLPNASSIEYPTGLPESGISIVRLDGLYGGLFPINFVFPIDLDLSIGTYWYAPNKIQITTGSNRSNIGGYVDVYFYYNQ